MRYVVRLLLVSCAAVKQCLDTSAGNSDPKRQRTISALPTLPCSGPIQCQCDNLLLLKGEALPHPACSHLIPCSSLYRLWHFSDPFLSCDQVNELFESVCSILVFLGWEARTMSQTPPSSWYRKHFPSGEKKPAGSVWEHDVMLGKQRPGMLLRISSVQIRASRSRALAFCAPQSQSALGAGM